MKLRPPILKSRPRPPVAGFTLLEIMVAIMIFSMVIAAIYATWSLVMRASRIGQNTSAQVQRQRVVLRTIEDALMGVESFQASQNYYWFQLENSGAPVLSFAARLPDTFARNGKFAGTKLGRDFYSRRVTFTLAADANGGNNLILRQTPILMDMDPDEQQYPLILARNVKKFSVEWWDFQQREWSSKDWVNTNSIPPVLRVNLVLGADTVAGGTAPDFAAARILTVPSTMMPVAVQRGGGGAPPGTPGQPAIKFPGQRR